MTFRAPHCISRQHSLVVINRAASMQCLEFSVMFPNSSSIPSFRRVDFIDDLRRPVSIQEQNMLLHFFLFDVTVNI